MTTSHKHTSGFTLIEIMVAIGIFAIVMTVSTGSLLSIINADKKSQSLKSVMNNLNFALDSMSRTIRVGTTYHCGNSGDLTSVQDCTGGSSYLAFERSGGNSGDSSDQIVYKLSGTQIVKSTDGGATFIGFTAPEVVIDTLNFYVNGTTSADNNQPRVIMVVRGSAGTNERTRTPFSLQTTVTQRALDE